ncbi:30258_t:CDS:2, partial [Gigaspora margarita]
NFNKKELKTIVNKILEALIENNDNKEESNFNDLFIAKLIDLNFYEIIKLKTTLNNQQELETKKDLNINLKAIFEEFQN